MKKKIFLLALITVNTFSLFGRINVNKTIKHYNTGFELVKAGKFTEALKILNDIIISLPSDLNTLRKVGGTHIWSLRGQTHFSLGNYQLSVNDFTQSISIDPNNAFSYLSRGLSFFVLGNTTAGLSDFKMAAQLGSKEAQDFLSKLGLKAQGT